MINQPVNDPPQIPSGIPNDQLPIKFRCLGGDSPRVVMWLNILDQPFFDPNLTLEEAKAAMVKLAKEVMRREARQ